MNTVPKSASDSLPVLWGALTDSAGTFILIKRSETGRADARLL